jgi:Family of unknown function (DUF5856)
MKDFELDFSEKIIAMNSLGPLYKLIQFQFQFKVFHWQTFSFAQHNAFGKVYDALDDLIDTFVETYQGIYGRVDFQGVTFMFNNLESSNFKNILQDNIDSLTTWENYFKNTDLLNIRDEILGSLNHAAYLLTFN